MSALTVSCGDYSTTSPTPLTPVNPSPVPPGPSNPLPAPVIWSGVVTDTLTGATVTGYTALLNGARVTVSAPGYVTRETQASARAIDLIPESGFNLPFFRQFARNGFDGALRPLVVLERAPAFFIETEGVKGFSTATAAELERVARRLVPQLTGGRFQVTRWETGPQPRERQDGWIMIERRTEGGQFCGSALAGDPAGQIWLDDNPDCHSLPSVFAHELGHSLGFWHVDQVGAMMFQVQDTHTSSTDAPNEAELRAARIAYSRPRGNLDVDVDP